ncbi:Hypothetical protein NTJ_04823 [Nesidiocoris tenuis]|uniref:Uncharacterized protein n=1 Tax=Nesidiocoris tenuis TaxID=355587 RepID=A0ABN7AIC4_9HEMI|nr:Hypothetical protein NTJ_04823 [Nesidiocoris tenuis]
MWADRAERRGRGAGAWRQLASANIPEALRFPRWRVVPPFPLTTHRFSSFGPLALGTVTSPAPCYSRLPDIGFNTSHTRPTSFPLRPTRELLWPISAGSNLGLTRSRRR